MVYYMKTDSMKKTTKRSKIFQDFLKSHLVKKGETDKVRTNTRIPDTELKIYGGSYCIEDNEYERFLELYSQHVFEDGNKEYLTEKQLQNELSPILIDIDLRFAANITTRQYTNEDLTHVIGLYLDEAKQLLSFESNVPIPIYAFEKQQVNILKAQEGTKDGIHIIIGIQMHPEVQLMLRDLVKEKLHTVVNWPITNSWDSVLDVSISRGTTNWQLYGSRKPSHDAYELTHYIEALFDSNDGEFELHPQNPIHFMANRKNLYKLSARYPDNISFPVQPHVESALVKRRTRTVNSDGGNTLVRKHLRIVSSYEDLAVASIQSMTQLDSVLERQFGDIINDDVRIMNEAHQYTMLLPENYSDDYELWIKTGFALKNTDKRLFPTWLKFSARSSKFRFDDVSDLYDRWDGFHSGDECLTYKSISYWARKHWASFSKDNNVDNEFDKVFKDTLEHHIKKTIDSEATDYDLAKVLHSLNQQRFLCTNFKHNIWYEYTHHNWREVEAGCALSLLLSTQMHDIYQERILSTTARFNSFSQEDDKWDGVEATISNMSSICQRLKDNGRKDKILKEAKILFHDRDFIRKMDSNPWLLCFTNGVVDFKRKEFRAGNPEDYITKSTRIAYKPVSEYRKTKKGNETIQQIELFMTQLFPVKELETYMWELLASCLIGINHNQTFNILTGVGSNGKSMLTKLMDFCLGEYKGLIPLTYVTQSRTGVGSASPEIAMLAGTRMAVMQEPKKDDKLNEGTMKELTGGDPIQARALYKDNITFTPQCKVFVCCNHEFVVDATDEGTWRRIRKVDFMSRFVENPVDNDPVYPYQFKKDMSLEARLDDWKEIFISMLVDIAYKTQGVVQDCEIVKASSDQYRNKQDHVMEFIHEKVRVMEGAKIKKGSLSSEFEQWYRTNHGRRPPKMKELIEVMDKRFGRYSKHSCWKNVELVYEDDDTDIM